MSADAALFDIAALRAIEAQATRACGDKRELMRRAGQAAWREVLQHWPHAQRLLVICGPGNNGGDGFELARIAHESGRRVRVLRLPAPSPCSELAKSACAEFEAAGGHVDRYKPGPGVAGPGERDVRQAGLTQAGVGQAGFGRPALGQADLGEADLGEADLGEADLVVDALFGIGLSRAPDDTATALIDAINRHAAPVLSLDVPSGIDADRGNAPGVAVMATRTLEFIAAKAGLRTGAALDYVGAMTVATLGASWTDETAPACAESLHADALQRWLRPRARDSHKGVNGRVLCIGGDHGSGGAIVLCAQAAARCGAGWTQVATRAAHVAALLARLPEAMADAVDDGAALSLRIAGADVIAIGPGLGRGEWAHGLLSCALSAGKPLVLDADALTLVAGAGKPLPADTILTPHPGEAARLLGIATADVQGDRFRAARALCERYRCVVVLKGAGTIVVAPGQTPRLVTAGNPGMAVAGMGDVLAGVIAALRAQGLDAFAAASCGALLHAVAGDAAADEGGERGMLPTDLMPWLRRLANPRGPQ